MRTKILSTVMAASFIVCAATVAELGALFWVSFGTFAVTCVYVSRHSGGLIRELDELFGKDDELR